MKIKWEIDDGFSGKARPHFIDVDDDEVAEYKTEEEREDFITECVQHDFDQVVDFNWEKA